MSQRKFWPVIGAMGAVLVAWGLLCPAARAANPPQGVRWASVPDVQNYDATFWWAQILFTKSNHVPWDQSDFATLAQSGMTGIEINPIWAVIEPQQGQYDFKVLDRYMAEAAKANLKVYLIFWLSESRGNNPPSWITTHGVSSDGVAAEEPPWWDMTARKAYFEYIAHTIDHVKASPSFGGVYTSYGWLDSEWGMPP
ncbi:MAG: beta-galactosidase, partial [Acidobacteriaceae bacterium]